MSASYPLLSLFYKINSASAPADATHALSRVHSEIDSVVQVSGVPVTQIVTCAHTHISARQTHMCLACLAGAWRASTTTAAG